MTYTPEVQSNLSTTVTLETEESGPCREVKFKQESMYGFSVRRDEKKRPLDEVLLYQWAKEQEKEKLLGGI